MTGIFNRELEPPEQDGSDVAYGILRAAVGLVPGAADILQLIIAPPLIKRQAEWMEDVAAALRDLQEQRGVTPEQLQNSPAFVDAVLSASPAAIRTSQVDKRTALRNAVLNAALPNAPELAVQQIFIALIDRFTEWHLRILALIENPQGWRDDDGRPLQDTNSLSGLITQAFPELRGRDELLDLIWSDLHSAGLHRTGGLRTMMSSAMAPRTTDTANQFLTFIRSPLTED